MKYRSLGRCGLRVSEIALGGWLTYGGSVDDETAKTCLRTAIEHGINYIDLADVYAHGESERVVGELLRDYQRSDLVISSKTFWPMSDNINDRGLSRKHIMESVEKSLKRLGTDYLDIYFCHRYDENTPMEETVRAMSDLVQQGKVLYWGTSVWEPDQIANAIDVADHFLDYRPQAEQPRYNMLDRHIEDSIIPACARHGIGLVVWSPLAQGILTGKYNDGTPEKSRGAESNWLDQELTPENIERVRSLSELAQELGLSVSQIALAWILRRKEISAVITGASRPEQVIANIAASGVQLEDDVLQRIETILTS
ncbi:MAG: aldo/keto reductase [Chloroflexi bacterium]|nr:aldo/keto reductase [Chloroflexota bacterium]